MAITVDPNMVNHPRTSSYVRTDDWDIEAAKWFEHKKEKAAEKAAAEKSSA